MTMEQKIGSVKTTVLPESEREKPGLESLDSSACSTLKWHRGPANHGEGTAGKDSWWDGDMLIAIVETNSGREVSLVTVSADGYQLSFYLAGTGEHWWWEGSDVWWWAKLDNFNLPIALGQPPATGGEASNLNQPSK